MTERRGRLASPRSGVVLVTRPHADSRRTLAAVRRRGLRAVAAPVLTVETVSAPVPTGGLPDVLVFTSGNAVRAMRAFGTPADWVDIPSIAVGERTAALLQAAGFSRVESAMGDGRAVARHCARHVPTGSNVLRIAGDGLGLDLDRMLTEQGHHVVRWTCYRTQAARRLDLQSRWLLARRRVSGVLLFSPRSARAFAKLTVRQGVWPPKRPMRIACISEATAKALLDSAGPNPLLTLCIAQRPDLDSTIDALLSAPRRNWIGKNASERSG